MADETNPKTGKNAYVTLLTRPSYLAGAILLAYTLHKHSPDTPLIITYTPDTVGDASIAAFEAEAKHSNIIVRAVEHLRLPEDGTKHGMVAERFIDTWTKLRVFDLYDVGFERLCWLDADMMIFSNPSPLIFNAENDTYLQGGDGMRIMATHVCVCNLDHDSWAPKEWVPENCAFTHLSDSCSVPEVSNQPETFGQFNSGTFVYRPSKALSDFVLAKFNELGNTRLRAMKFPDQDFLNEAFASRWASLSWRTNALKTWRYWHANVWDDGQVGVLHYIVDKPWAARVKADGSAGYLGKDGETHKWWWGEYEKWQHERMAQNEAGLLATVSKYAAAEDGEESEEMKAIGGGAQDYAKKWKDGREVGGEDGELPQSQKSGGQDGESAQSQKVEGQDGESAQSQKVEGQDGEQFPQLQKKVERGHGRVVRGRGRGRGEGWSIMEA